MLKSLDVAEDSLSMISTEARNKEAAERQQDRAAFVSNALGDSWPEAETLEIPLDSKEWSESLPSMIGVYI